VTRVEIDYATILHIDADVDIIIEETDFVLHTTTGVDRSLGALLDQVLVAMVIELSGELRLTFGDGTRVEVMPHKAYEAWEVNGPGTRKVVCMPGGELAIWS
jgi:Family of unknown function (DUF6188)